MTILAKGTYVHKSEKVKKAIQAISGDAQVHFDGETGRTVLSGEVMTAAGMWKIEAAWNGNAWDYEAGSLNGKKVRNLKELLRKLGIESAQIS
jgi:hypothetical protein